MIALRVGPMAVVLTLALLGPAALAQAPPPGIGEPGFPPSDPATYAEDAVAYLTEGGCDNVDPLGGSLPFSTAKAAACTASDLAAPDGFVVKFMDANSGLLTPVVIVNEGKDLVINIQAKAAAQGSATATYTVAKQRLVGLALHLDCGAAPAEAAPEPCDLDASEVARSNAVLTDNSGKATLRVPSAALATLFDRMPADGAPVHLMLVDIRPNNEDNRVSSFSAVSQAAHQANLPAIADLVDAQLWHPVVLTRDVASPALAAAQSDLPLPALPRESNGVPGGDFEGDPVLSGYRTYYRSEPTTEVNLTGEGAMRFLDVGPADISADGSWNPDGVLDIYDRPYGVVVLKAAPGLTFGEIAGVSVGYLVVSKTEAGAIQFNHYISFDQDQDGLTDGCISSVYRKTTAAPAWQAASWGPTDNYTVHKWRNCTQDDEFPPFPASWGDGDGGPVIQFSLQTLQQQAGALPIKSVAVQGFQGGGFAPSTDTLYLDAFAVHVQDRLVADVDATPGPGTTCEAPCTDNSIAEEHGATQLYLGLPPEVQAATGICDVHVKQAGPSGSDFARYYLYSDVDDDGVTDLNELLAGTDPVRDESAPVCGSPLVNPAADSDGDGLRDVDEDADGDGQLDDGETDPSSPDTDGDGLNDCQEAGYVADSPDNGQASRLCAAGPSYHTDPRNADSDGDGLSDGIETGAMALPLEEPRRTNPTDADSDDDNLPDGVEDANQNGATDAGETDPLDADSDNDNLTDCQETGYVANAPGLGEDVTSPRTCVPASKYHTNPLADDSDSDGAIDGYEVLRGTNPTDAASVPTPIDTDGDGVDDDVEVQYGSDPNDSDTDGDGIPDGIENADHDHVVDSDETDAREADTDDDGLSDGIEDANQNGLQDPGETDPLDADTDGDSLSDGEEDADHDGVVDSEETDPRLADTDADGLDDAEEGVQGTDARDNDSDDDGVQDGPEVAYGSDPNNADTDADGLADGQENSNGNAVREASETSATNPDTDGDGLPDGLEVASTRTDPLDADTDNDGLMDGAEDVNENDLVDAGETDGTNPDTDADLVHDGPEVLYGSNPLLADTDGDTLADGAENSNHDGVKDDDETSALLADTDGDSLDDNVEADTDPLLPDTDSDGLTDCQETGYVAASPGLGEDTTSPRVCGTNLPKYHTDPVIADSDGDGVSDGDEVNGVDPTGTPGTFTPTNPTVADTDGDGIGDEQDRVIQPLQDQAGAVDALCADADDAIQDGIITSCTQAATLAATVAGAGALAVLNTIRAPFPLALIEPSCNFLDPGSWGTPQGTYSGPVVNFDAAADPVVEAEDAAYNGLIAWTDDDGSYLLWDGDACQDLGDPGDRDEGATPSPDESSLQSQHLGNYILGIATQQPTPDDVIALLTGLGEDAYGANLLDVRDPADVDEDGNVNEPNGQVDLIEDRLLIVDPHGAMPNFDVNDGGAAADAVPPITGDLPEDATGISLVVRDPRNGQIRATISVYAPIALEPSPGPQADVPVAIVEVFNGADVQHVCVVLEDPFVLGPAPGRYAGACPASTGDLPDPCDVLGEGPACGGPLPEPCDVLADTPVCGGPVPDPCELLEDNPLCEGPTPEPCDVLAETPACGGPTPTPCDVSEQLPGCDEPAPDPCDEQPDLPTCGNDPPVADTDGDDVPDAIDQCPEEPGSPQQGGCNAAPDLLALLVPPCDTASGTAYVCRTQGGMVGLGIRIVLPGARFTL